MLKLNKAPLQIKIQLKLYNQNFNLLNHVLHRYISLIKKMAEQTETKLT